MFASVVIGILVLIIAIIVYVEYKNEKTYEEERKRRSEERRKPKPPHKPEKEVQKPVQEKKATVNRIKTPTPDIKEPVVPKKEEKITAPVEKTVRKPPEEIKTVKEETVPAEKKEEKIYDLPTCEYPEFNYSRLLKMGLSKDEAIEFIKELIPQIKTQLPLIKEAMEKEDFHNMERLTHSLKGSSTTVGTGGVSDLLVEFNTYLKTGKDIPVAEVYFTHLNRYTEELEKQFA